MPSHGGLDPPDRLRPAQRLSATYPAGELCVYSAARNKQSRSKTLRVSARSGGDTPLLAKPAARSCSGLRARSCQQVERWLKGHSPALGASIAASAAAKEDKNRAKRDVAGPGSGSARFAGERSDRSDRADRDIQRRSSDGSSARTGWRATGPRQVDAGGHAHTGRGPVTPRSGGSGPHRSHSFGREPGDEGFGSQNAFKSFRSSSSLPAPLLSPRALAPGRQPYGFGPEPVHAANGRGGGFDARGPRHGPRGGSSDGGFKPGHRGGFDHDYPSLGGPARHTWQPQSPRLKPSEQPQEGNWTSRLAEVPAHVTAHPLLPNGTSGASALAAGTSQPQPRMADTIQAAAAAAAATPALSDKQRAELVERRQAKQLIPIVTSASLTRERPGSNKSKSLTHSAASAAAAPGTLRPLGDALGRSRSMPSAAKKADDPVPGSGSTLTLSLGLRRGMAAGQAATDANPAGVAAGGVIPEVPAAANGTATPTSAAAAAKPAVRERDRSNFFQSLRKKADKASSNASISPASSLDASGSAALVQSAGAAGTAGKAEAEGQHPSSATPHSSGDLGVEHGEASGEMSAAAIDSAAVELTPQQRAADVAEKVPASPVQAISPALQQVKHSDSARRDSFDLNDPRLKVTEEEEAFLRSLGWTGDDDDAEGGLTEEEIAAFNAKAAALQARTACPRFPPAVAVPAQAPVANGQLHPAVVGSYGSFVSSSDSDSD
ncbi:hypothetical protein WJX72_007623 [[Myrmecia] bisecta]|uniref:Uncharacterized protein n=1 Tax=[Myrmecia] bisecta TaxID=41462 RepID=A0AAW1Q4L1_9CHLO